LDAYRDAIESGDPELVSKGWYNLGNALYRQQQLQEALEAYKQSLRADPSDADAKHNLERVLEQMQEQEQEQGGEGGEGDDRQEQQEQQEQQDQEGQQDRGEQEEQQPQRQQEQEPQQQGQMSREEAERLLQAIQEDPGEIQRQRARSSVRRRPRRDW
jgi:tetratricopeptide (TPR) repeat protein